MQISVCLSCDVRAKMRQEREGAGGTKRIGWRMRRKERGNWNARVSVWVARLTVFTRNTRQWYLQFHISDKIYILNDVKHTCAPCLWTFFLRGFRCRCDSRCLLFNFNRYVWIYSIYCPAHITPITNACTCPCPCHAVSCATMDNVSRARD